MPNRQRRRNRPRRRRAPARRMTVFSPSATPRAFSAPPVLTTTIEYQVSVTKLLQDYTLGSLITALRNQYGLYPENSTVKKDTTFSVSLLTVQFWLIPTAGISPYGELTVHICDPPTNGTSFLRQIKSYSNAIAPARIGFNYPPAIRQLTIPSDQSNYKVFRAFHNYIKEETLQMLVRWKVKLYIYGGDSAPTFVEPQ